MRKLPPKDAPDAAPLQAVEFTTHPLPGAAQFGAFRAAYGGVFDIVPTKGSDAAFPVRQKTWRLDRLVLVSAQLPGPDQAFGWRHARRTALDHGYVLLPFHGAAPEPFQGRAAAPSLHCLAAPFQAELTADGMLMLFFPRDFLPVDPAAVLDRALDTGAGRLLADVLALLCRHLPRLRAAELPGVIEAIQGLIAACAAPSDDPPPEAPDPVDLRLLDRAKRLIAHRIAEPDLSPASLCQELFVSRSRLYRTFEPLGGVSAHIRRQRLLRARVTLLDARDARSIARIAEHWGFADASTFSRAFKQEFGASPRMVRKAGWVGSDPRGGAQEPPDQDDASSLYALLRRTRS